MLTYDYHQNHNDRRDRRRKEIFIHGHDFLMPISFPIATGISSY